MLKTTQIYALRGKYTPYDTMPAFDEGVKAYQGGNYKNPHSGMAAQAWDRGAEFAMRADRIINS